MKTPKNNINPNKTSNVPLTSTNVFAEYNDVKNPGIKPVHGCGLRNWVIPNHKTTKEIAILKIIFPYSDLFIDFSFLFLIYKLSLSVKYITPTTGFEPASPKDGSFRDSWTTGLSNVGINDI